MPLADIKYYKLVYNTNLQDELGILFVLIYK